MTLRIARRQLIAGTAAALAAPAFAQSTPAWSAIEAKAKGQTVYFNAWGGSETINAYIQWAAGEAQKRFGVTVQHVKIADAPDMIKRVRNEKAAGKTSGFFLLLISSTKSALAASQHLHHLDTWSREGMEFQYQHCQTPL